MSKTQHVLYETYHSSRGEKRLNGGYRPLIHQQTTTGLCNNAKKVQDSGSCRAMCTLNGRYSETLRCGFMAYLDVARQFLALLSLRTWRRPSPPQQFCTSTLISAMIASRPQTVWCDPLSVSSTARVKMRGNNWICSSPPVTMEIVNQHTSRLVRFSYR